MKTLGASNGELFKRCLLRKSNACLPKSFSPQLRCFALTLHCYSPRAYEYVREKFNNCLPHPKTISAWYRTVNGEPGIGSEAMKSITERVKNTNYPLLGCLMFDEMAIREHVEYDGSKFSVHIDYGKDIACELDIDATQVSVFMIVCLNGSWKVPVAYYFMKGASAEGKTTFTVQCLEAMHEIGLKVVSLTYDGTATNLSVLNKLGCNFKNVNSLQTSFRHPTTEEDIVAFLDPCHMIKLIRNTLGDSTNLLDGDSHHIKWSYLKQLHDIQQNEGMCNAVSR